MDAVSRQAFTQGLDDRDASRHSRFKRHHHTFFVSSGKNFSAMHSEQSFVGRDHVLACINGFKHQLLGNAITTDQLNHDVNLGVGNDLTCITDHLNGVPHDGFGTRHI
jgi:hypothetical protein